MAVTNMDDTIDSRDVIERIEELEDLLTPQDEEDAIAESEDYADEREELAALKALADEASDYAPDWEHGETLIRDSYFTDYVRELLEDCGDIPRNLPSYVEVDWEATARNIRMDYSAVDFDGVTYWIR